ADDCRTVRIPRPTGIAVDPTNDRNVWVGLEVDGVRYSTDGGDTWAKGNGQIPNHDGHTALRVDGGGATWAKVNGPGPNQDVHNVLVIEGPPKTVFTVVNDDIWRSTDDGKTWQAARAPALLPPHSS